MSPYCYPPLSSVHDTIRLLRLFPHQDKNADIQCELFEYSLQDTQSSVTHLYEALSYVWGDPDDKLPILVNQHRFDVTHSLTRALSRLRNHSLERILWVDAICINQSDQEEKENQIQSMARIYNQAIRVVVWLGEAADNSSKAFQGMCCDMSKSSISVSDRDEFESAGLALLCRPWFQRIWVLQEVSAARSILITCGPDEIDGYAFSLGVESWRVFPSIRRVLQDFIFPVTYLIREAIFRPRNSLGTCSLGGLLDMYHTHKATKCHDKVYALLGMSSDDLSNAGLSPNYMIIWEELMQRLLKHIISDMIAVEVARNKQATVIRSSGHTLGTVQEVEDDPIRGDRLCLQVSKSSIGHDMAWTVQATAKRVRPGDIICCLQGASQPTIVRVRKDYFMVVAIAVEILEMKKTYQHSGELEGGPDRNFLLVWDWEESPQMSQDLEWYNMWKKTGDWKMGGQTLEEEDHLARARRTWNVALILNDITRVSLNSGLETRKEEAGRRAVADCDMVVRHKGSHQSGVRSSAVSQPWAVDIYGDGNNAVLELLLPEVSLNTDFDRYPTGYLQPLRWAALGEHEGVLELLFNSMHEPPKGLLLQAAEYGHKALVRLLLKTGKVDVDMKDHLGRTPLFWAAKCGHQDVVQLLLKTGKVDVSTKDEKGCTLLYKAAERGHKAIVRLLLKTGKVDVDTKDKWGCTPLFRAAERGHQDVVRILLKTGKVDVDTKDRWGHTLLYKAAERGHTVIVRSLLKTGKVDVDTKDEQGRTPLWKAAEHGHKAIVQLLLKTGTADVDMKDKEGLTPLWTAAEHEHEDIVRLLLKTGKVEVDIKDEEGWTPLLVAVAYGREDMVKLVLETGKVIPEMDHIHGETMLSHALQVLEQGGPPTDQEWQNWLDYSAEWKTEAWDKKYRNIVKMLREAAKGK